MGISHVSDTLPDPVYALLSGLNSATVGIIALAAVQLSSKTITDKLTRILVFFGGTAGMLYNTLWYFPVLMVAGGLATVVWDYRVPHTVMAWVKAVIVGRRDEEAGNGDMHAEHQIEMANMVPANVSAKDQTSDTLNRRTTTASLPVPITASIQETSPIPASEVDSASRDHHVSLRLGLLILLSFLALFTTTMVLRGTLTTPPQPFSLFANLLLAGTIIFGGGPVVIPLLRSYVVAEGWVSSRDFLLGLALCQAFPGPNFNFAVYLGALAAGPAPAGALLAYVAIFAPGLALHSATMHAWRRLRRRRWLVAALRGLNATAVGLIYAAVYRLWEIGAVGRDFRDGASLGGDPWWLVTAATAFVGGMWFDVSAPLAIVLGGVMGLIWYGVVRR